MMQYPEKVEDFAKSLEDALSINNSHSSAFEKWDHLQESIVAIVLCIVCHMYSLSLSVGDEGFICDKCREIVRLTEKILELETRIQTLVEDSKNVRAVDTALDATSSASHVHCSVPDEPVQQGNWVT